MFGHLELLTLVLQENGWLMGLLTLASQSALANPLHNINADEREEDE